MTTSPNGTGPRPKAQKPPATQCVQKTVAATGPGVVLRDTRCKTILNRSTISDYSLNCYTGCSHGCVYCYARFMQRFHPHPEPWGAFVDVKVNAVEALERQLRRAKPGNVFVSSACDAWQPVEGKRKLTRECCRLLLAHGFHVNVLTKSALVLRDLDVLSHPHARIGVTITTLDERLRTLWEPHASKVEDRLRVLRHAKRADITTAVMFGPLLPFLSDTQESIDALFQHAADIDVDMISVDAMNPRPRVWPSVAALLRRSFPDLHPRYRHVLFDDRVRADYLAQLRRRIMRAAERLSLADRVSGCV